MNQNHESSADTQWPRWEVLKQDTPKKPHQAVGSVHAGDAEHALLTARNVFVRRPSAVSLWVVPAEAIFSVTAQALTQRPELARATNDGNVSDYLIFCKTGHRRSMTFVEHVGEISARCPGGALERALATYPQEDAVTWWVVPKDAIICSDEKDVESWFAPAETKTYKQQSAYGQIGTHPSERKHEVR